ncbi:hypothetical protein, partial [Bacillus toyonensis]|uniref:hypothetical protein n=1 Tax=Bacillus toyonensis TaxID=155322 RepID=UPI002E1E67D7|nr:hypothetical protein [Bacillus toyonensis]
KFIVTINKKLNYKVTRKWYAILSFLFLGLKYKKENPYNKDSATGKNKNIIIKRITYIII